MNLIFKTLLHICLISVIAFECHAQIENYEYRANISRAKVGWNTINLPSEIFDQSKNNLNDIRIYSKEKSTDKYIEQPYFIDIQSAKNDIKIIEFKTINESHKKDLYTYTFALSNTNEVNKIKLDFSNQNYDWKVHLEGSMDNQNWATIVDSYRIVSINNSDIKFTHSEITIPTSKFNFYRISFQSPEKPNLNKTTLSKETRTQPTLATYAVTSTVQEEDEKLKTTSFTINFEKTLPLSQITINVNNENDYYRPFTIEGAADSFNTDKGWNFKYKLLYRGTINSLNNRTYNFENQLVKKVKITVYNFDNQPLDYANQVFKGPKYRLITRLEETDNLTLVYGNQKINRPKYDIGYFKEKIPKNLNAAEVGTVEYYPKVTQKTDPLFKNKWWLWVILVGVIFVLGFFTLKMIKEEK
jgi:hypothetical protein